MENIEIEELIESFEDLEDILKNLLDYNNDHDPKNIGDENV